VALGWLGWSEERTLHSDVNAIIIGFTGAMQRIAAENGADPFAPPKPALQPPQRQYEHGHIPDPSKLPVLTPGAFDAMFPGKRPAQGKVPRKLR
jgi:hypothetical protein